METSNSVLKQVVLFLILLTVVSSPLRASTVNNWGTGFTDIEYPDDPYTVSDDHFQFPDPFFGLSHVDKDEKYFASIFDTHTSHGPYHHPDTTPGFVPIIEMPQTTKAEFSKGYWNLNDAWPNSNKALWYKNRYRHGLTPPAIPIPSAIYLFVSGILGLIGFCKCRKR